jgi:SAM-dependent methyltransferase
MPEATRSRLETLSGKGLLQTQQEWDTRNRVLIDTIAELIVHFAPSGASRALDIGCQTGTLTDAWMAKTGYQWSGLDPRLEAPRMSAAGADLSPGYSNDLSRYDDGSFDVAVLANVYEHILPEQRVASFREAHRVLRPGGVLVGQIPNPYFPIESHSRLPFMGWLPPRAQKAYWKLAPVSWPHDFYSVTPRHLLRDSAAGGLEKALLRNFNYPPEVIPRQVRWVARLLERPMRRLPWAWQFVLRRP